MTEKLELSGAGKAAKKRAESLSPDRRSQIASLAAQARWSTEKTDKIDNSGMLRAEFEGPLCIGELVLPAAVLTNNQRVLSERGLMATLGGTRSGSHYRRLPSSEPRLPQFVAASYLQPFVPPSLRVALSQRLEYQPKHGGRSAFGFEATLLAEICQVWLAASRAGVLPTGQERIAKNAEILMFTLAKVGIIALIDEATGYQEVRDRYELRRILEAYISKELLPWTRHFPEEFYRELFRLRNWPYSPPQPKRPSLVGKLTNDLIYAKLPEGVLDELRTKNPVVKNNWRAFKHFQFLTDDVGDPHLQRQIVAVTTLMKAAPSWYAFRRMFARAFPAAGTQFELEMPDDD